MSFCVSVYMALWSPAGKGLTSWLSFVVSTMSLSLSNWYPGSGVVLDCIDSWSLHPYLLCDNAQTRLSLHWSLKWDIIWIFDISWILKLSLLCDNALTRPSLRWLLKWEIIWILIILEFWSSVEFATMHRLARAFADRWNENKWNMLVWTVRILFCMLIWPPKITWLSSVTIMHHNNISSYHN